MGDIFELHSKVMQDYRDFVRASVHIADPRLRDFVDAELNAGRLWPDVMCRSARATGARRRGGPGREGLLSSGDR